MNFHQRLVSLMDEYGYTNYRVAKLLDCHQSAVANWVSGKNIPQKHTIAKLANIFGVSVEYLKGESDDRGETKTAPVQPDKRYSSDDINLMRMALESAMMQKFNRLDDEDQQDIICQVLLKLQSPKYQDDQQ